MSAPTGHRAVSYTHLSAEAKITVHIEKADTKVTYADMEGNPAHKAAIRLAEEGIYVGQYMNGHYFFDPKQPVSRAQFLTMAMAVSGLEAMEDVTLTGFSDDSAIPVSYTHLDVYKRQLNDHLFHGALALKLRLTRHLLAPLSRHAD